MFNTGHQRRLRGEISVCVPPWAACQVVVGRRMCEASEACSRPGLCVCDVCVLITVNIMQWAAGLVNKWLLHCLAKSGNREKFKILQIIQILKI